MAQQQLLVGEGRLQLGDLDRPVGETGRLGRDAGRRRVVEGPERRVVALGPVVEPGDPGRPLDQLAGPVAGGEHHRGGAVGDRRARRGGAAARGRSRWRAAASTSPLPGTARTPRPWSARRRCRRR